MDKYTELKGKIDSKYSNGLVQQSENIISLYDLITMLKEEMEPLRKVKIDKEFQEKIDADRTIFQRIGLFKKQAIVKGKCNGGYTSVEQNRSTISLHFEEKNSSFDRCIVLHKDFDSQEIYFADFCYKDRDFVTKYISEIYGIFAVLENYGTIFPYEEKKGRIGITQEFNDELLSVTVNLDTFGRVSTSIVPTKDNDPDGVYTRDWYSRETISKHVDGMSEQILRSIPIEISSLNEVYKTLVERAIGKRQAKLLAKGGMAN